MSELELPASIVLKLIKEGQSGDNTVIISKDVKKAFQQISGLFTLYLFSNANDISKEHKRKKVLPDDIYQALSELGYEKYVEQLKEFMKNYTEKEDESKKQLFKKRILNEDEGQQQESSKKTKENDFNEEEEDKEESCHVIDIKQSNLQESKKEE